MNKKVKKIISVIVYTLCALLCGISLFIIGFNFSHTYSEVIGESMYPTLVGKPNLQTKSYGVYDSVFISKLKAYSHGDIVVATRYEDGVKKNVVKRIIAMQNDKIKIEQNNSTFQIIIIFAGQSEETVLDESDYLSSDVSMEITYNCFANAKFEQMGFSMENNFLIIPENCYFILGDNRENSKDSSVYGPVEKSLIVGKVDYVVKKSQFRYFQVLKQLLGI